MKRACFVCLTQLFTCAILLSQSNPVPLLNPSARAASPVAASMRDPRDEVRLRRQRGKWPLGFDGMSLDASSIFLEAPNYSSGTGDAVALTAADVNGDGKLDLVLANGGVGVLLGNGDGTFQAAANYASGGDNAESVAVADVNGDGIPDLLVANECAGDCEFDERGAVGVLLGNGDGTFQAAVSYDTGGFLANSVAVGDVNGDGKPDLVVANQNSVGVLLGNGDGTFQPALSYGSGGLSVAVADVNGDGKPDLVVAGCGGVCILLGNGDGTFKPAVSYNSGGSIAVTVADVNGDGKPDLLVANECDSSSPDCRYGSAGVLLGNGDGTFQAAVSYDTGGYLASSVVVGDVNGDGKPDLIVANQSAAVFESNYGSVGVLLGKGDGTFRPVQNYAINGGPAFAVTVADVNRDGKPDLLVANGNVAVLLGDGNGTFQAAPNYAEAVGSPSVAAADVNGDDKPDILEAYCDDSNCTGEVGVLLGKGNGTFRPPGQAYATGGSSPQAIVVADVNDDNKPDLLVLNQCISSTDCATGSIGVLLGKGDGTFQPVQTIDPGGGYTVSMAVADVNGDGKPDLLVANYYSSINQPSNAMVMVLLGNGNGTFQPAVSYYAGGVGADSIEVADVNGDGKPDLLVANDCVSPSDCTTGVVGVLLGNRDGTFQPAVSYNLGERYPDAGSLAVGDINGDGKLDLIVANGSYPNPDLAVLIGNGDGTFQPALFTSIPVVGGEDIVVDDFNGDGKLDVATSDGFVLLGNGDGTFQTPLDLGISGVGIAVGDFNRDGRPDLVLGNVAILLNISTGFGSPTTTTLVSSTSPAKQGQEVRFTATISSSSGGIPAGQVTFRDGTTFLATKTLIGGTARFTTSNLPAGLNGITAAFGGNSKFGASTSSAVNQVVLTPTTTTLSSSANPSGYGQPVTFTAAVTSSAGAPQDGETILFVEDLTILGSKKLSGGSASFTTSALPVGTHLITAVYGGDSSLARSASAWVKQVVKKAGE